MKWIVLALLFSLNVLNYTDKSIIGVAAAPMMKELGLNYEQWGLVGSSFYWLMFVATAIGGALSDRFGPKKVLAYMAIIWTLAQFIPFVASSFALLLFARFLLGVGEGPFWPVAINQMNRWFPQEQRGLATSIISVGAIVGKSVIIPVLVLLVVNYGWRVAFLSTAVASFAWFLLWITLSKERPTGIVAKEMVQTRGQLEKLHWKSLLPVFRNPSFLFPSLAIFAGSWVVAFSLVFLPNYFTEVRGLSPQWMGIVIAIGGLGGAVLGLVFSMYSDYLFKKRKTFRGSRVLFSSIGMIVAGLGFYSITMVESPIMMMVGYALEGGFVALIISIGPQIITTAMPDRPGTIMGLGIAFGSLSGIIAPLVSGKIIQSSGTMIQTGFSQAFLVSAILCVLSGLLMALFTKPDAGISLSSPTEEEQSSVSSK